MKPIHLNLASRPYRDYRAVYAAAAALGIVTAILMLYNLQTAYRYVVNTRDTREQIAMTEGKIRDEQQRTRDIQQRLARIDRKALDAEAHYINLQIADRAFSWTQLLDRLERLTPRDVRLTSLNPQVMDAGETHLELNCVAKNPDEMLVFIDRINADPHFSNPVPHSESESNGEWTFSLGADYHPEQKPVSAAATVKEVRR